MTIQQGEYGPNYQAHLLEQYKLYVEMADRISSRRQSTNSFFLSVNTAIIALLSYINMGSNNGSSFYCLVSLAGMSLCLMWYKLLCSYKNLNTAKFEVIHEMEAKLPISPYDSEWKKVENGNNSKLYLPFTHIEFYIPWVFFVIYVFIFLNNLHIISLIKIVCGE